MDYSEGGGEDQGKKRGRPKGKKGRSQLEILTGDVAIGAKPNLYCQAIELVCGGSPHVCVLVERKALYSNHQTSPIPKE